MYAAVTNRLYYLSQMKCLRQNTCANGGIGNLRFSPAALNLVKHPIIIVNIFCGYNRLDYLSRVDRLRYNTCTSGGHAVPWGFVMLIVLLEAYFISGNWLCIFFYEFLEYGKNIFYVFTVTFGIPVITTHLFFQLCKLH